MAHEINHDDTECHTPDMVEAQHESDIVDEIVNYLDREIGGTDLDYLIFGIKNIANTVIDKKQDR